MRSFLKPENNIKIIKIFFIFLSICILSSCTTKEIIIMQNIDDLLKVTLTSKGKRELVYDKSQAIHVEFTIKNISNIDIEIPVEFINAKGLAFLVTDKKTGERFDTWPILADLKNYTTLHPGEHVTIIDRLEMMGEIDILDRKYANSNFDLQVSCYTPIRFNNKSISVNVTDTIPLLNIKKP
jgi:hypothetical protein